MAKVTRLNFACLVLALLASSSAEAADIHVICPTALAAPMKALGDAYSRQGGARVMFTFDKIQAIRAQLASGVTADLVVLSQPAIESLEDSGLLQRDSARALGHVPLAVAVRTDGAAPDISDLVRFRSALLAASAVAYTDPATGSGGGLLAANLLAQPEFKGVHGKAVAGPASAAVIRGDASMALQPMSELVRTTGIKIAGPVPPKLHASLDFVAAVSRGGAPETVAFLKFLTSTSNVDVWTRNGVEQ